MVCKVHIDFAGVEMCGSIVVVDERCRIAPIGIVPLDENDFVLPVVVDVCVCITKLISVALQRIDVVINSTRKEMEYNFPTACGVFETGYDKRVAMRVIDVPQCAPLCETCVHLHVQVGHIA